MRKELDFREQNERNGVFRAIIYPAKDPKGFVWALKTKQKPLAFVRLKPFFFGLCTTILSRFE